MASQIMNPLKAIPRLTTTPTILAKRQKEDAEKLEAAAKSLDREVGRLEADLDLTDTARGRKVSKLRQRFSDDFSGTWAELRSRGALAEELLAAFFTDAAIRARIVLEAKPVDAAAMVTMLDSMVSFDLYLTSVEAARTDDPLLAALILNEVRGRLVADTISLADAEAIMRLCEGVELPADEISTRTILQDVQVAGIEADDMFRAASSGQLPTAIARLQTQRRIEAVRSALPEPAAPMDPNRFTSENLKKVGLLP